MLDRQLVLPVEAVTRTLFEALQKVRHSQVSLKAEYRDWYPSIEPGIWQSAASPDP